MYRNILIPTDGSELSKQAGSKAIQLAKTLKAKATVLLVSPTFRQLMDEGFAGVAMAVKKRDWEIAVGERARVVLDAVAAEAKAAGVPCVTMHVFRDLPHAAIIDAARKSACDLIVMGTHGYGGFKQWVLGSETTRVLSQSKVPVLVYR